MEAEKEKPLFECVFPGNRGEVGGRGGSCSRGESGEGMGMGDHDEDVGINPSRNFEMPVEAARRHLNQAKILTLPEAKAQSEVLL